MNRVLISALILILPALAWCQTPEQKKATIQWLQDLQCSDGGFVVARDDARLDQTPKGGLRATSGVLWALEFFGAHAKDEKAAARFVLSCYDPATGTFSEQPGAKTDVFTTSVGLMVTKRLNLQKSIVVEKSVAYLSAQAKEFEDIRIAAAGFEAANVKPPIAKTWCSLLQARANPDGSYGKGAEKARATGGTVAALLRLGESPADHRTQALATMNAGQNKDGGYGKDESGASDLETTYRVVRCYHMLAASPPKVEALHGFIAKCRNNDGGYGIQPGKPSHAGATYYAGILLRWLATTP